MRFCAGRLTDGFHEIFADVGLTEYGAWEPEGLRHALEQKAVLDPWVGFQRLLDKELEMVHVHLGGRRADELRRRIDEFARAGVR